MESFRGCSSRPLGEDSLQMWDLNKRLEAYLARVKFLEEENELLKAEIQGLKGGSVETPWRAKYEAEVAALRAALDRAYQEKCVAELARDSLHEEARRVRSHCQRERAAQEEAKRLLSLDKKEMEEEKRAHIWLREKATQLETEMEDLVEAHQEELLRLDQEINSFSQSLDGFRAVPVCFQPVEVEDYAKRLSNIWKGAVETYKTEVSQLEASLCEAKENLWKATERNRQNQLQLQQLEKELASLQGRKKTLEESLSQQWAQQQGDAEKLQMAMEALEEEKQSLRGQIAQVLEDRQQLMHLKMSLSLEVATYRTLLEAESARLQLPATDLQLARGLRDATITESTHVRLPGPSMDGGRSGSWDVRPSPAAFPKLRGFHSKVESASWGTKSLSSAAREFQKANASLRHSQATRSADGLLLPPKETSAFRLDASQHSQRVTVTQLESLAQSVFCTQPPLTFNSLELEEASGRSPESLDQGEESKRGAEREAEGRGGEEGKASGEKETEEEEEEEEETRLRHEPPAEREVLNGPFLSQMVTEAVETAIQEVIPKETHLESSLLKAVKSQTDVSSDRVSSLEEENKDTLPPTRTEGLEEAQEDHMGESQPTDLLEDLQVCEDFAEVNGGQEAWAELQGPEEAWQALEAEAPWALGAGPPRVERTEEGGAVLVPEDQEGDEERGSPEWKEGEADEELPALLGMTLGNLLGEAPRNSEFATEAPAKVSGNQEGWELDSPPSDVPEGAPEVKPEEVHGGTEEVEMVSPEDLLSERREEPQSPTREGEPCNLQAGLFEREHLEVEGSPAEEDPSSAILTASSAGEHQAALFPEGEQESVESHEELLHEADSAPPEEENQPKDLDSELFCTEGDRPRSSGSALDEDGISADEPERVESREAAEEEEGDVVRSLPTEDTGDEGTMETEGPLDGEAPKSTWEVGVASLQAQETLQEEQRTEVPEEQPPEEQEEGGREGGGGFSGTPLQAEGSNVEERGSETISGVSETEDIMDALEMEEVRGAVVAGKLLPKEENAPEGSEDRELGLDSPQAGEPPAEAEGPSTEETTCPEEVQGSPPEAESLAEDSVFRGEDSGSEDTSKHLEILPDFQRERAGAGEETLPAPLALDNGLTVPETPPIPSLGREETPPLAPEAEAPLSGEDAASVKVDGVEEGAPKGESGHSPQALPEEVGPCSEELLAAEGPAEARVQRSPLTGEDEDQGPGESGVPGEDEREELEGAPGREPEEDPWQESEVARGPAVPKEEMDAELPLGPGEPGGFPADGLDARYSQHEEEEEEGPLEFSDPEATVVAPAKVSPLTSVAHLEEIVLEGESSLPGPRGAVESDLLESGEDEGFLVLDPEDLIQQKTLTVEGPPGSGVPETFPEDVVGLSLDSQRDPNILEIVEQALEFNQELMKAAEEELGGLGSPEERSPYAPPAGRDRGLPRLSPEAPEGSSPVPREAHLSLESQANGLQEEASLEDFPSELLNGLGQEETDPPGDDGFVKRVTITPQFCTEGHFPMAETLSQSPPPIPGCEEGLRSGGISPEGLEKVSLDLEGQEALEENLLEQKSCGKGGKETKLEPRPFLFGDDIRHQPLEFHPEGDLDLQPSEDH
ncbi:nestin [Crotalus tigris]|uniref:nestin n=1 Tax=Crotalus tigris TaxID=88082 RepID=UPI00192F6BB5|nr:nestin [Crotalus tigris]